MFSFKRLCTAVIIVFLLAGCFEAPVAQALVINEFVASNGATISDADGDYEDWIELYNGTGEPIDLTGYFLSDDDDEPLMWSFPGGTIPSGGHLLVWASGKDKTDGDGAFHTNFSISSDGEPLLLSTPQGQLLDRVPPVVLPRDISYGRKPDGAEDGRYFDAPTPGSSNNTVGYRGILEPPEFSHEAGFYTEGFPLELSHPDSGATIFYTLDGGTPGATSLPYQAPLWIDSRAGDPDTISLIPTSHWWEPPRSEVFKITVVRAVAVRLEYLSLHSATNSYLVDPDIHERYHVPVVSLVTDADNFFDDAIGIYVKGDLWEELYPDTPFWNPANYHERGPEWERPVHFTFIEPGGPVGFSQDAGVRIHGGATRSLCIKSLRLYARNEYGTDSFEYPLFGPDKTGDFRRFILRNSGSDFQSTYFRDALIQQLVVGLGLDQQHYRPSVVFLNGEYWGIHNIRDRQDKYYLEYRHGVDPDNLDILTRSSRLVKEGDALHYNAMMNFLATEDIADPANYLHLNTLMDVDNYLNYQSVQVYIGNTDWPVGNIDYWRLRTEQYEPEAPYGHDGRWRWILYDTDFGFEMIRVDHDTLSFATAEDGSGPNPPLSTLLFRTLLQNMEFRAGFINRISDLMNSVFLPEVVEEQIIGMRDVIGPLMPEHIDRWSRPGSLEHWQDQVQQMIDFGHQRPQHMREHIIQNFALPGQSVITVVLIPAYRGKVRINTLVIEDAPEYWQGVYFQGVPIELEALPAPGFAFAGWDGLPAGSPALVEVDLTGDITLTAHFERADEPALLHYWNFNAESTAPSHTVGGAYLETIPGADTEFTYGTGQGYFGDNARFEDEAGSHFRVNDPVGASLTFQVPTTGFEDIVFAYETRRSGQGAGIQEAYYTLDGAVYEPYGTFAVYDDVPVVHELDFFRIEGTGNNPEFAVRIEFAEGLGGDAGNNRFDNVTVESIPGGINRPPVVAVPPGLLRGIEQGETVAVALDEVFSDPDGDELTYEVVMNRTGIADAVLETDVLALSPRSRGDVEITVHADDGHHDPVPISFRLLVYPRAHRVADGPFTFDAWSPDAPDGAFPAHMLFLQSNETDPGVDASLDVAYHIPHDDYSEDDLDTVGYPYNNTRRTRINGLGEDGISFINTGRDRDLGGALLALDTTDSASDVLLGWLSGTVLQNERRYAIRPQYRIGYEGPFLDLPGDTWEYLVGEDGDVNDFGPLLLPETLLEEPYVQLLWRYYHVDGDSGPRAALRLDDIVISATEPIEGEIVPVEGEAVMEGELVGEGEAPVVEGETEGEGESEGEGEGEGDSEGEGEIEGEDEPPDEESRCGIVERCGCGDSGDKRLRDRLGDWLMVGLAAMLLLLMSRPYRCK